MAEDRRSRLLHGAKIVVFSLAPAIVLFVVAEVAASISISRDSSLAVDSATGRGVYTMRMGKWPWSRRAITPLNSLTFPDVEFPPASSSKTCTHVVFAGDSFTFGDGVDRDSNFVEIVRRGLAQTHPARCVRIFNLGERGTTIDRQTRRILETLERTRADIVILGQYQNDLTDLTSPGAHLGPPAPPPGAADWRLARPPTPGLNLNIVRLLTYHSIAFMIQRRIVRDELRRWSVLADTSRKAEAIRLQQAYSQLYGELVAVLQKHRTALGVIILPSKLDVLAARYPEEAFFISLAERHAVPYLRVFPILDDRRSPFAFLMYDGHMNELGNRLVADAVLQWLRVGESSPFEALRKTGP